MTYYCDSHIHSHNSFDAQSSVESICLKALEIGLNTITITDHMEAPEISRGADSEYGDMVKQIKKSVKDVEQCQRKFNGKLRVLKGIELGEPMHDPVLTQEALDIANFDFILASIHNLKNEKDFYFLNYNEDNVPTLLSRYFEELLDTARNADFDSLAHLTYPLRYITERTHIKSEQILVNYTDIIDEILKTLVIREKALELNTSGVSKERFNSTMPGAEQIKRFKQLGGKYVTIGSDAHNSDNITQGFDEGIRLLKESGFDSVTVYENRKPEYVKI